MVQFLSQHLIIVNKVWESKGKLKKDQFNKHSMLSKNGESFMILLIKREKDYTHLIKLLKLLALPKRPWMTTTV